MPLRVIRELFDAADGDIDRVRALAAQGASVLERALSQEGRRTSRAELLERLELPERALDRLAEVGVISSGEDGYRASEVRILEAIARFRAAGWNEQTGFGARDVARLMKGLEPVIADELQLLIEHFAALDPDRAAELLDAGAAPFGDLISALHAKALADELERRK